MKGIDTNVLVRYILQDDIEQGKKATKFIESECSVESPGFINSIVLCELVWVLETAYQYPKQDIANVIEKILKIKQFFIHESEIIWQTLYSYKNSKADFADNYIGKLNTYHGCKYTVTFDKKAVRLENFKPI